MKADKEPIKNEGVFAVLDEFGMSDKKEDVKRWYDGLNVLNYELAIMNLEVRLINRMIHGWFAGIISDYFREWIWEVK